MVSINFLCAVDFLVYCCGFIDGVFCIYVLTDLRHCDVAASFVRMYMLAPGANLRIRTRNFMQASFLTDVLPRSYIGSLRIIMHGGVLIVGE